MLAIITTATLILINCDGGTTATVRKPIQTPTPVRRDLPWPRILGKRSDYYFVEPERIDP
jgi:hypothetical protein